MVEDDISFDTLKSTDVFSFYVYDDNEDPWAQKKEQYVMMGENPVKIMLSQERIIENGELFSNRRNIYEKRRFAYR